MFIDYLGQEWSEELHKVLISDYFVRLGKFLREEREKYIVYPQDTKSIFKAFKITPFNQVRGVILGQD